MKGKPMRIFKRILAVIAAFIVLLVSAFLVYSADYYHALPKAVAASAGDGDIAVSQSDDNLVFAPPNPSAGFIFYPGGKVEFSSYSPLMQELAKNGILCVLVKMPANLAILNIGAAKGIRDKYPDIKDWYIGGHSLGGVAAAQFAGENSDDFEGLILLASYSTSDLADSSLRVLSVYGKNDGVLKMDSYKANFCNLPANCEEFIIDGGCHSYFGCYGIQKGDGKPEISNEEQIKITSDKIAEFIGG